MNTDTMTFAVLMHPVPGTDQWQATVVCQEGPTALLPQRPFVAAVTAVKEEMNNMVMASRPIPGVVHLWMVTADADFVDWLQEEDLPELFHRLHGLPVEMIDVSHREITVHTELLSD